MLRRLLLVGVATGLLAGISVSDAEAKDVCDDRVHDECKKGCKGWWFPESCVAMCKFCSWGSGTVKTAA